jgi:hypothetical protein
MISLRSWIDRHILMIGVVMLFVGVAAWILAGIRGLVPAIIEPGELSMIGLFLTVLAALAGPLTYNSVLLIVTGLLLKRGEQTLVGFEHTAAADLRVEGPDANGTVWLGRQFHTSFDAEVAASALAARFKAQERQKDRPQL